MAARVGSREEDGGREEARDCRLRDCDAGD